MGFREPIQRGKTLDKGDTIYLRVTYRPRLPIEVFEPDMGRRLLKLEGDPEGQEWWTKLEK